MALSQSQITKNHNVLGGLALEILKETSPELAIKIAYDFARKLRFEGAEESEFEACLAQWTEPFEDTLLIKYIRAGFKAGFFSAPLPWRREIDGQT